MTNARCVLTVAGVGLLSLLLTACAASPQTASENPPSPSEEYLSTESEAGWTRTVERDKGFVLVFETVEEFDAAGPWDYRLILFNESDSVATWDELFLGLQGTAEGAPWEGFESGLGGGRQFEPIPPVTLRSGESTTNEVSTRLENPPLTYEVVGVATDLRGFETRTETVTVVSR